MKKVKCLLRIVKYMLIICACLIFLLIGSFCTVFGTAELISTRDYEETSGELWRDEWNGSEQMRDADEPYRGYYTYYVNGKAYTIKTDSGIKKTKIKYDPMDPREYIIPREFYTWIIVGMVFLFIDVVLCKRFSLLVPITCGKRM